MKVAGVVAASILDDGALFLDEVLTVHRYRGKGVFREIMRSVSSIVNNCETFDLIVVKGKPAVRAYKAYGWESQLNVDSLKVADLRKQLDSRGLSTKGRKKQLAERLEAALDRVPLPGSPVEDELYMRVDRKDLEAELARSGFADMPLDGLRVAMYPGKSSMHPRLYGELVGMVYEEHSHEEGFTIEDARNLIDPGDDNTELYFVAFEV